MKTIKINLFEFNELSEQAKQKAIEKNYAINVQHDWWDCTYEDAKNIGLKLKSFDLDRNRHATGQFMYAANEVAANILKEHGEDCETYKTTVNFMDNWQPVFNDYMDSSSENYESRDLENTLMDLENDYLTDLLEDYSIMLQNECEYLQSEEAIIETFEANGYTFEEDGTMNNSN